VNGAAVGSAGHQTRRLRNAAIAAAVSNPDISPLEFLLGVMRDPNVSADLRIKAAQVHLVITWCEHGVSDDWPTDC
jgi:hypothetical protein